ncbi:MAG: phosphoenolpyruvate--protein phosphotransferase [Clostridia bacterium]|nr:phosphoenolpyruvate--protein phosphotransferase [Clostridia bacterium]
MKGISASKGIAIGKVLVWQDEVPMIEKRSIEETSEEIAKFKGAVEKSINQIQAIRNKVASEIGEEEAQVFDAHALLFEDPEWIGRIEKEIESKALNAEYITDTVSSEIIALFESIEDEYLRARAADIKDVTARLIKNILGMTVGLSDIDEPVIIVAKDLTPSETALLDKSKVLAFITEQGNKTSHSAIIARTMDIPAIVGAEGLVNTLVGMNASMLAMDGSTGDISINPDAATLKQYSDSKVAYEQEKALKEEMRGLSSVTLDGKTVELSGNIAQPKEAELVVEADGEGVGLFRSEFLFMDGSEAPSEEKQYEAYYQAAKNLDGRPLVIRTLDAGGDKNIPYLNVEAEMNPFLGYRAIRICLNEVDLFKTQIKAILRVSADFPVKIMFPMIATVNEFLSANKYVEDVMQAMKEEHLAFDENIEIGIMVEIPSTAVMADVFAKYVDFFSIGTNDLTQYTLAADRMNPKLSGLYNHRDPAVLRLIHMVIEAAHKEGKWVGMCGEAAGDEMMIPVLLGLGLDEFSMAPSSILGARRIVRNFDIAASKDKVEKALLLHRVEEVEAHMKELLEETAK